MERIFDTHAHYDGAAFDEDREELLDRMPGKGIVRVVNVGASLDSCRRTLELMKRYNYIYGALGVHPSECAELDEEGIKWLRRQCQADKCVALGEIGLDYYWDEPGREVQKKWFVRQLELARELKLPVVIHSKSRRDRGSDSLLFLYEGNGADFSGYGILFWDRRGSDL